MLIENELESIRNENRLVFTLSVLFVAVLLVAICALSVMVLNQLKQLPPTAQQATPGLLMPTAGAPAPQPLAMPANLFLVRLPVIQTGSVSLPEQIWRVSKIKNLGYELDGQRYDLATFTRPDSQNTLQGYCMNRGWDVPAIGAEYLLNAEGIFVPLYETGANPLQRFSMIQ
jgi:hypothetical protein